MIHYNCKIDKFIEKDGYINGFEKRINRNKRPTFKY